MDRRTSLKALALGTISAGVILEACNGTGDKTAKAPLAQQYNIDRMPEEVVWYEKISKETFFTPHEMATITVLADIICPRDEVSGSASEAGVPEFIEFIVKDMPQHQLPMRGGLRWLDMQCLNRYGKPFKDCSQEEQIAMVDEIAYPAKAKPEMQPGVAFFNKMRDLTLTGFYTSKMGIEDLGYVGNRPNKWNGVPDEVLKEYGLAYTQRDEEVCVKYDTNMS